ncbi:hypothetical protein G5C51_19100, partial [Streptomyces sp. A7024]|nr:hypothetical protein [Streptomyces coryli]
AGIDPVEAAPDPRRWLVRGAVGAALTAVALFSFPGPQIGGLFDDKGPGTSERAGTAPRTPPSATPTAPPSSAKPTPKPTPEPSRTKSSPSADADADADKDADSRDTEEDKTTTDSGPRTATGGGSTPAPQPTQQKKVPGGKFYDWSVWLPGGR